MLQDLKKLLGRKLHAADGDLGHVDDFYFDDASWTLRYLVADTGPWLSGRKVLLSHHAFTPQAFGRAAADAPALSVNLTRKQIEDCPPVETHQPVSRQYEVDYHRYYGWPEYWESGAMSGMAIFPTMSSPPIPDDRPHLRDDIHLRSAKAVTGYAIQATDGAIGSVVGFMIDGRTWKIRELVVETGHWYAGKKILLLPGNVTRVSYEDSAVFVDLTRADIAQTTVNDVAQPAVGHH